MGWSGIDRIARSNRLLRVILMKNSHQFLQMFDAGVQLSRIFRTRSVFPMNKIVQPQAENDLARPPILKGWALFIGI